MRSTKIPTIARQAAGSTTVRSMIPGSARSASGATSPMPTLNSQKCTLSGPAICAIAASWALGVPLPSATAISQAV